MSQLLINHGQTCTSFVCLLNFKRGKIYQYLGGSDPCPTSLRGSQGSVHQSLNLDPRERRCLSYTRDLRIYRPRKLQMLDLSSLGVEGQGHATSPSPK
ncbi:hypothetical protein E2C01_075999 [Portunus trituberculatus]|uniref:Uncharacterized protein n=1 Tax=Portunus trituberculatus TaxID=210409 RepID=A0A5B7IGQ0_PORTR|nr:hypothetical protein [Portunus trituberculatus]